MHTAKAQARILFDFLENAGVTDVVISPGSRNAPLIIEAEAREHFRKTVIVDERSAAFIALGMADATGKPVALFCTSGTAVLNYYPAVAEAFYRKIPLIVVSADRPSYRIDKGEGQSIRQAGVLEKHVVAHASLCERDQEEEWIGEFQRVFAKQKALNGPVHINVPFEEPLYETVPDHRQISISLSEKTEAPPVEAGRLERLVDIWNKASGKMILVSQGKFDDILQVQLEKTASLPDTIVLTENTSNVTGKNILAHIDRLIFSLDDEEWQELAPDLVVTVGQNIISKKIKFLLRKTGKPLQHWHIGTDYIVPDTFDALTEHIATTPEMFFSQLLFGIYDRKLASSYAAKWQELSRYRRQKHESFADRHTDRSDWRFFYLLSKTLKEKWHIHWANSTVIRYAQLFDFDPSVRHYGNRGTSGIDGSLSTVLGFAMRSGEPVLHVSGDLSALYDSNALWPVWPANFKLILLVNGGGDIFRFIPGPETVSNFEKYFVAEQALPDWEKLFSAYGKTVEGIISSGTDFSQKLHAFLHGDKQILIIDTSSASNAGLLRRYFASLK